LWTSIVHSLSGRPSGDETQRMIRFGRWHLLDTTLTHKVYPVVLGYSLTNAPLNVPDRKPEYLGPLAGFDSPWL
jgi:hypothetical protein